jgi:hypothetical protein
MAQEMTDRIAGDLGSGGRCRTRRIPLGLHGPAGEAVRLARAEAGRLGLAPRAGARLVRRYGDDWREAVAMIGRDRRYASPRPTACPSASSRTVAGRKPGSVSQNPHRYLAPPRNPGSPAVRATTVPPASVSS